MKAIHIFFLIFLAGWMISCSDSKQDQEEDDDNTLLEDRPANPENSSYQVQMVGFDTALFNQHYEKRVTPPMLDLNQSMEGKTVSELELLKNTLLAMKGKLFEDALYHQYFDTMAWYQPPFWDSTYTITLNDDEQWFVDRIETQSAELKINNLKDDGTPNLENTLNAFQWPDLIDHKSLKNHGFFMENSDNDQLFNIYEANQRKQIPSFITTDLILHQMHLFYGMLENEIEGKYLTEKLKTMIEIINLELYASYEKTLDPKIEQAIEESLLYYSIPYAVITAKKTNLIGRYNEMYVEELTKVNNESGKGSQIMNNDEFDYAIFKPFGHYTKNSEIKKYYKSLTWLQKVSLCLDHEIDFNRALVIAYIINRSDKLKNEYREYIELKTYFSSQKQQFTLWDLASSIGKDENIRLFEDLFKPESVAKIKANLGVQDEENCQLKVSLMPIEFQNLFTDLKEITGRENAVSSIDLFAALRNPGATDVFMQRTVNSIDEEYLAIITENLIDLSSQENARSMDWISTLLISYNAESQNYSHLSNQSWKMKGLNTVMGSWTQLNQRVNLRYRNKAAETSPSTGKVLVGFVEPNLIFWDNALILLSNTKDFLSSRDMLSSKSAKNLNNLMDLIRFLDDISKKELNKEPISANEFNEINSIGEKCHTMTLQLINLQFDAMHQQLVNNMIHGTPIFRNAGTATLIGGIGRPNILMTLVEINGNIYLTRGATYSYYELPDYNRSSINQSNWIKMIEDQLAPPKWAASLYPEEISGPVASN